MGFWCRCFSENFAKSLRRAFLNSISVRLLQTWLPLWINAFFSPATLLKKPLLRRLFFKFNIIFITATKYFPLWNDYFYLLLFNKFISIFSINMFLFFFRAFVFITFLLLWKNSRSLLSSREHLVRTQKFPETLTFRTPWYAHKFCILAKIMKCVERKNFVTFWLNKITMQFSEKNVIKNNKHETTQTTEMLIDWLK